MATQTTTTDHEALLERLNLGKPLDSETYRRIRERGESITDDLRKRHGEMNLAVELIRAARDEA
jgi:hypothetical protein